MKYYEKKSERLQRKKNNNKQNTITNKNPHLFVNYGQIKINILRIPGQKKRNITHTTKILQATMLIEIKHRNKFSPNPKNR